MCSSPTSVLARTTAFISSSAAALTFRRSRQSSRTALPIRSSAQKRPPSMPSISSSRWSRKSFSAFFAGYSVNVPLNRSAPSPRRRQLRGGRKPRLDVDRNGVQAIERLLHDGSHGAEPIAERFRGRVVAVALDRHDLPRQSRDAVLDLRAVDTEGAVGVRDEAALIEQVIELHRNAFAVRLRDSETDRSKRGREVRRIQRLLNRFGQHPFIDHVLHGPEPRNIRLRFLEKTGLLLHRLPHRRLASAGADRVRTEAVHQLVDDDLREEGVEGHILLIRRREDDLRNRDERFRKLRILHVLEHAALRALFARDALVVRQIECGRLDTSVAVTRDRKSTRLNSSHIPLSRMPSSA